MVALVAEQINYADDVGWYRKAPYIIERSNPNDDIVLQVDGNITTYDSHPDIFNVNAPGLSGQFFFENVTPETLLPTTSYEDYIYEAKVLNHNSFKVNNTIATRESFDVFGFPELFDGTPVTNGSTSETGSVSLAYFKDLHLSSNNGLDYFFEKTIL